MRRCEGEKMTCVDVKMRRCEDVKMHHRTHDLKNPSLRRSQEQTKNFYTQKSLHTDTCVHNKTFGHKS